LALQAQFQRAQRLHWDQQNVSLKDLQAAESKFRSDEAQFNLLGQRLAHYWGEEIAAMPPQIRAVLIAALVKRTSAKQLRTPPMTTPRPSPTAANARQSWSVAA
jgi:hypothetical protein